jgi:hypothetical protein
MRALALCSLLATLIAGGCGLLTGPGSISNGSGLVARASRGALILRNESPQPIHYVAIEERAAALVDLHFDITQWPVIAAGREIRLPYREIMGYAPAARSIVVHCAAPGARCESALRVPLR